MQEVIRAGVGVQPNFSVGVEGRVLVYCDPEHYPAQIPKERAFGVAIGVHPKQVAFFQNSQYGKLRDYLRLKEVVALGDTGLDHTEPKEYMERAGHVDLRCCSIVCPFVHLSFIY